MLLQGYDYELIYRPGAELGNSDALSRLPLPETVETPVPEPVINLMEHLDAGPVTSQDVRTKTRTDPLLARVSQYTLQGWPDKYPSEELMPYYKRRDELSYQDGCLLWGTRVIVPPPCRAILIEELHEAHPGITRIKGLARNYMWWPSMDSELEQHVLRCPSCQVNQKAPAKAPLHPWEYAINPWSRLHIDFAGPFLGSMFLVVVDSHSKWLEVFPMNTITSEATINRLRACFATHGLPDCLVSDNGPSLASEEFRQFTQMNGIRHIFAAPYHPATNGLAERAVQTMKDGLRKMSGGTLQERVTRWLANYRLTPNSTTGRSPAEMLLRRQPKSRLDLIRPNIRSRMEGKHDKMKIQHDQHAKSRELNIGEPVLVRNFARGPTWLAGTLIECTGPVSFKAQLADGRLVRRHVDHLLRRVGNTPAPELSPPTPDELLDRSRLTAPPGVPSEPLQSPEVPLADAQPAATVTPQTPARLPHVSPLPPPTSVPSTAVSAAPTRRYPNRLNRGVPPPRLDL